MSEPTDYDLTLRHGIPFTKTWQLYSDSRLKRWRNEYNGAASYRVGDGVRAEDGTAWVAIIRGQGVSPLDAGQTHWSALTPMNLTGYTAKALVGSIGTWAGFTFTPTIEAGAGKVTVTITATEFNGAPIPSSAHWYLELTDSGGSPSVPIDGTMRFRQP